MAIRIRSTDEIAAKFIAVTPGRAAEYARGVGDPNVDWENPTRAAEGAYEAGVTDGISRKAFGKGVASAGNAKWQTGATGKGVSRWPTGVAASADAYRSGYGPYRDVIAGMTLPQRGPTGSPQNIQRVAAIAEALHARKIAG